MQGPLRRMPLVGAMVAVSLLMGLVIALPAKADTTVGTEATCKFTVAKYDENYSAAIDYILPNCWYVQAKNISAETFHTYWWYYPYSTHIGPVDQIRAFASKLSNVTVANYGRAQYCTEDDPNTNECGPYPTYWTQWYWGW